MLKVHPPLGACVTFSFKTIGPVLGGILLLGIAVRFFYGKPFIGFLSIAELTLLSIGSSGLLGIILYLILRPWAWSVESSGLTGRSQWGRRSRIAWGDVDKVWLTSNDGIPALVISSAKSKREVFAYTLGVDIPEIHTHLVRHAGPQHVLTQWFRSAGA